MEQETSTEPSHDIIEGVVVDQIPGEEEPFEISEEMRNEIFNQHKPLPKHPSGVDCIEIARHMGFNLGSVMNHIWNDGLPNHEVGLDSLNQAKWYLQDQIDYLTAQQESS